MIRPRFPALVAVLIAAAICLARPVLAAEGDPLFADNGLLKISIEGPLRKLQRDRSEAGERLPGVLGYTGPDGRPASLEVELQPRGQSRRDREVCTFPPLWLHFNRKSVKDTVFARQNKVKMVTYCRSPKGFQDYIVKEYLAYRIFNRLSDASFRVRLLEVSFKEAGSNGKPLVRYGFFIEHKKRLAKRLDLKVQEPPGRISPNALEPAQAAIAELFQYMVSNTDFSFIAPPENDSCCHNTVLLGEEEQTDSIYVPVPYDFDRTGLVNPPNGLPAAELGQRSFRQRVYRGFCRPPEYLQAAIARTLEARGDIEDLIQGEAALGQRARAGALNFLAGYYDVVNDPGRRQRELKCRALR